MIVSNVCNKLLALIGTMKANIAPPIANVHPNAIHNNPPMVRNNAMCTRGFFVILEQMPSSVCRFLWVGII